MNNNHYFSHVDCDEHHHIWPVNHDTCKSILISYSKCGNGDSDLLEEAKVLADTANEEQLLEFIKENLVGRSQGYRLDLVCVEPEASFQPF